MNSTGFQSKVEKTPSFFNFALDWSDNKIIVKEILVRSCGISSVNTWYKSESIYVVKCDWSWEISRVELKDHIHKLKILGSERLWKRWIVGVCEQ